MQHRTGPADAGAYHRAADSQPVLWYRLICDAEAFRLRSGMGLASVWHYIHSEDYPRARSVLDELVSRFESTENKRANRERDEP